MKKQNVLFHDAGATRRTYRFRIFRHREYFGIWKIAADSYAEAEKHVHNTFIPPFWTTIFDGDEIDETNCLAFEFIPAKPRTIKLTSGGN